MLPVNILLSLASLYGLLLNYYLHKVLPKPNQIAVKKTPFLLLLFFFACSPKIIPIKGTYPQTPIIYYSDKAKDQVWDNIVDMFAQKGLSIKIIDKSSGLIVSDHSKVTWSHENKNGQLIRKDAFVVIPGIYDRSSEKLIKPDYITGEWNIRIKEENGRTSININLVNLTATYQGSTDYYTYTKNRAKVVDIDGRTTGVFEKIIYDIVK